MTPCISHARTPWPGKHVRFSGRSAKEDSRQRGPKGYFVWLARFAMNAGAIGHQLTNNADDQTRSTTVKAEDKPEKFSSFKLRLKRLPSDALRRLCEIAEDELSSRGEADISAMPAREFEAYIGKQLAKSEKSKQSKPNDDNKEKGNSYER